MPLDIVNVHFDCAGSRALSLWRRAHSHMVVTFRGRRKGKRVLWRFKVDFS